MLVKLDRSQIKIGKILDKGMENVHDDIISEINNCIINPSEKLKATLKNIPKKYHTRGVIDLTVLAYLARYYVGQLKFEVARSNMMEYNASDKDNSRKIIEHIDVKEEFMPKKVFMLYNHSKMKTIYSDALDESFSDSSIERTLMDAFHESFAQFSLTLPEEKVVTFSKGSYHIPLQQCFDAIKFISFKAFLNLYVIKERQLEDVLVRTTETLCVQYDTLYDKYHRSEEQKPLSMETLEDDLNEAKQVFVELFTNDTTNTDLGILYGIAKYSIVWLIAYGGGDKKDIRECVFQGLVADAVVKKGTNTPCNIHIDSIFLQELLKNEQPVIMNDLVSRIITSS